MKKIIRLTVAAGILISACNMPSVLPPDPQMATAAALTVQAVLNNPPGTTPLASPTIGGPEVTPTFSQPMASVGEVTNCRSGPGTNYERISQILPTDQVKIIGFFSPNYWIVSTQNGECWLSGEFATPVGSFAAVPTVTAPATPQGGTPKAPTFPKNGWSWFCYGTGQTDVTLSWNDNSDNEIGYRIYRNDELIAELPADSTFFKETVPYPGGLGLKYTVEVFNEIGAASGSTETLFC
jgi:hypothetical protein